MGTQPSANPATRRAYLSNVCVAHSARRQVGMQAGTLRGVRLYPDCHGKGCQQNAGVHDVQHLRCCFRTLRCGMHR